MRQQKSLIALNDKGFVSITEQERQQQQLLDAKQAKQNIARQMLQLQNQLDQIKFERSNMPQEYALKINSLKRQKSDIERQLVQVETDHEYTVVASHSGTVAAVQVVEGETLKQAKPLVHIIPADSDLVAQLLLPTRSAGFVSMGQSTRLRFDAFPYQRFGFVESQLTRIDKALITPNEVELPISLQEPVYRLRAKLSQQQVKAYGKAFELRSGMLFEADIMLEQRTLIEWLLEPIYSLRGRVS